MCIKAIKFLIRNQVLSNATLVGFRKFFLSKHYQLFQERIQHPDGFFLA
jgi:hypothetical protein